MLPEETELKWNLSYSTKLSPNKVGNPHKLSSFGKKTALYRKQSYTVVKYSTSLL